MKREDYVKKATARIFDDRQKRAVSAELEDHIAHRTAALEEIGYDPERAEAQGVEAMGDPAEICDQLGALHNRFYTPVWDIVLLLLWGGLLAGAYFALRQYVFGDVGLTALLNAGACLVPGCACLYGVWCLHRNHPVTAALANSRLDNRLAHVFGRVGAVLGVLCLAATIALGVKAPADVRAFAEEYKAVYAYLLQVTQSAKDMDALCAEIEDSPYAFESERTDDGELLSATYQHNYVLAQVEPQEIQSRAELEAEYQKEIAKFQDSLEKLGSDPEMAEEISRTYAQSTREQAYRSQVSGIVRLGLNSDLVGTDLDKRSAHFLTVDTAGRQALFDRKMAGKKDRVVLEQLSGVVPYKWKVEYTLQRLGNCRYDWTYLVGSDKYRCEAAFSAKRQDTATAAAMEQLDRVAATVEKNPKLRRADLARKIGAKLQAPRVSEDRYTAQYDSLGSRFDQLKEWAHQRYELSFQYQFGDYYFCLAGKPYSTVTLYDKDGCLLSSRLLVSGDFSGTHGNLRRPLLDRGYYDRQGNFYPQPHFVPAYTRDGKAYLYYYWKSPDGDATKNVQYLYAMDDPAARLEPTGAYIDSDGYLVTGVQVKKKQKDGSVIGSDGKTYYPYLRTGWTAQGKPCMAHQPSELEEMLQSLDTAQNTE